MLENRCESEMSCLLVFLWETLGKYGLMFYNACTIIIPTFLLSTCTGDLQKVTTLLCVGVNKYELIRQ